jgi:hypothetical protein
VVFGYLAGSIATAILVCRALGLPGGYPMEEVAVQVWFTPGVCLGDQVCSALKKKSLSDFREGIKKSSDGRNNESTQ